MSCARFALLLLLYFCLLSFNRSAHGQNTPGPDTPAPAPQPAQQNPSAQQTPPPAPDSSSQSPPNAPNTQNPYPQPAPNPPPLMRGRNFQAPWAGADHWGPFSRVGIGADISPLGIGIKGAVILTQTIDARLMGNFLTFNTSRFEVEGTRVQGTVHLASLQTAVDFYPKNSIWRLSAGALLWNANQMSAKGYEVPGNSFTLAGQTYYSSMTAPVGASGTMGLHSNEPALTASFGFGRYVPRSSRHWSFPSEFGVVFMGAPTLNIAAFGTVCLTAVETTATCSDVTDTSNPVGAQFNKSLDVAVARWRRSLAEVNLYPIFSYAVVYSFTIRKK